MATQKKPRKRNLKLVEKDTTVDNKKVVRRDVVAPDLTFTAESKEALETTPNMVGLIEALQLLTYKHQTEIQKFGAKHGIDLNCRIVYNAVKSGG